MKTIVLVANTAWNLNNFRAPIIDALLARGDRVIAVAPEDDASRLLEDRGCEFRHVRIDAKGINPLADMRLVADLRRIYAETNPDIVLHFTIKPVIYGSFAARLRRIPALNTITGLGTAFIRQGWITRIVERLYRTSLARSQPVVFQNSDDLALFRERRLVTGNPCFVVPGSGVDLSAFAQAGPPESDKVCFLLVARLLKDKGVYEFVEAASQIRRDYPKVHFQILGPVAVANRTAVPDETLQHWISDGIIDHLGEKTDIRPEIANAHCIVLPSYREGLSRVLLEASAMGRPMIATDVPGCRDVVNDGVNGFLCRPRDADDLSMAIRRFLELSTAQRGAMGDAARARAVREFDSEIVVSRYLGLIDNHAVSAG